MVGEKRQGGRADVRTAQFTATEHGEIASAVPNSDFSSRENPGVIQKRSLATLISGGYNIESPPPCPQPGPNLNTTQQRV